MQLELAADLTRHARAVNAVRWSPCGDYLATGDDDGDIIIWRLKSDSEPINICGKFAVEPTGCYFRRIMFLCFLFVLLLCDRRREGIGQRDLDDVQIVERPYKRRIRFVMVIRFQVLVIRSSRQHSHRMGCHKKQENISA